MTGESHTNWKGEGPDGPRVLVVANETIEGGVLHRLIAARARGGGVVLVVAPALNSRLRHWASDGDLACRRAAIRMDRCLGRLARAGIEAEGRVGDSDPLLAIADALELFPAGELIISTHPEARSNWLAHRLVERARERFGLPTTHVVVDLDRRVEYVPEDERQLVPAA
jgi:hypothetical protein